MFTDPSYNVPIKGHVIARGGRHREFAMASGEMDEETFQAFLVQSMTLLAKHAGIGSLQYVCMDWRHAGAMIAAGTQAFHDLVNICVWTKPNAGMGSFYRSQHELVFVFKSGSGSVQNNVQLGRYGRNRSNVWAYAGQPA